MINAETRERLWNAAGVPVRCGGQLYLLSHGRIFSCEDCPEGMELLRAMAGPSAGLILWLVLRSSDNGFLSAAGEMSLMLSLVNLLPAPGLDGGRVLNAVLSGTVSPDFIDNLFERFGILTSLLAVLLGVLHSPQLFLYGLWLFLRMVKLRLRD